METYLMYTHAPDWWLRHFWKCAIIIASSYTWATKFLCSNITLLHPQENIVNTAFCLFVCFRVCLFFSQKKSSAPFKGGCCGHHHFLPAHFPSKTSRSQASLMDMKWLSPRRWRPRGNEKNGGQDMIGGMMATRNPKANHRKWMHKPCKSWDNLHKKTGSGFPLFLYQQYWGLVWGTMVVNNPWPYYKALLGGFPSYHFEPCKVGPQPIVIFGASERGFDPIYNWYFSIVGG